MACNREMEEVKEVEEVVVAGEQSPQPPRNYEVADAMAGNWLIKPMPIPWRATVMWSRSTHRSAQLPRRCEVVP